MKKNLFTISVILLISSYSGVLAQPEHQPTKKENEQFIDLTDEPKPLVPFAEIFYYPTLAKDGGLEGRAMIDALIDTDGNIIKTGIAISSGIELLDYAAVDIIRKQRYTPAIAPNNQKVKMWLSTPIVFKLGEERHKKRIRYATLPENLKMPLIINVANYNVTAATDLLATVSVNNDGTVSAVSILPTVSSQVVALVSDKIKEYHFFSTRKNRGTSKMRTAFVRIKIEMN